MSIMKNVSRVSALLCWICSQLILVVRIVCKCLAFCCRDFGVRICASCTQLRKEMSISTPLKSFDDSDSEDLSRMLCLDMTEEDRFMDLGNKLLPTSSQCSVEDSKRSDRASQFNSSVRNECSNGNQSSSMKKFARFTLNSQNETSQSMRTAWKSTTSSNTNESESRPEIKPLTHSPSSSSSGRELLSEVLEQDRIREHVQCQERYLIQRVLTSRTSVALLSDSIAVYRLRKSVADPNNAVGVIVDVSLKVNEQNELNDRSVTYQPGDRVLLPNHRGILYSDNAIPGVIFELYRKGEIIGFSCR
ncbi:hypothetical protein M3Y98_00881200 [Aphelenchoides besseyi]|nr:hypothetical protein M3Y98_00881200 [Aphelenchoides besseyi]